MRLDELMLSTPRIATPRSFSLRALEEAARAASPGPWRECGHDTGGCKCRMVWSLPSDGHVATAEEAGPFSDGFTPDAAQANAAFIAAANPAAVLRLIAEVRRRGGPAELDYWPGV